MRDDTLKAIADELARARKKYPTRGEHARYLQSYANEMVSAFTHHEIGRGSAAQVYACAVAVAAMAIRCIEEGDSQFRYSGNRQDAPKFELTP